MSDHPDLDDLLEFPCDYEFKAFGPNSAEFREALLTSIGVVLTVSRHAVRERESNGGKYRCVTVLLRVHSREQLNEVYRRIRQVDGLRYLL